MSFFADSAFFTDVDSLTGRLKTLRLAPLSVRRLVVRSYGTLAYAAAVGVAYRPAGYLVRVYHDYDYGSLGEFRRV